MKYRAFPPGRGHLKIPTESKRSVRSGLAMYAPCRPKGIIARWVSWQMVGVLGPWALPGRPVEWEPPAPEGVWGALHEAWAKAGGTFDSMVVHERLQASRTGVSLLLLSAGRATAFVKLRQGDDPGIENEFLALEAMWDHGPKAVEVPRPLAVGEIGGWRYLVTSAIASELHRAPSGDLERVLQEIRGGLASLHRPDGDPRHWEPMHGDFTPWNLREREDGSVFLIDWEDAGWGPPGADETLYKTVTAYLSGTEPVAVSSEARDFWANRLRQRQAMTSGDVDAELGAGLLALLER